MKDKTLHFVPLATIIGGFIVMVLDGFYPEFNVNEGMFTAMIYAGLGSSAAIGVTKFWNFTRREKTDD
jgi:hypothetical protein